MEHSKEIVIKILDISLELYRAFYRLEKAGLPFEFLAEKGHDLFNSVLDLLEFIPEETIFEKEGETGTTNRDYLISYLLDVIEYKKDHTEQMSAEQVYGDLKRM